MRIDVKREENIVNIKLIGKYDLEESLFFNTVFSSEISRKPMVIALNLKDLTYIDSSGIGSLIRYMNIASNENIDFLCYDLNNNIEKIFRISKLDQFLPIMTDEDFNKKYKKLCSFVS